MSEQYKIVFMLKSEDPGITDSMFEEWDALIEYLRENGKPGNLPVTVGYAIKWVS